MSSNSKSIQNAQPSPPQSANISFTEPPDIKIIEASCKQSNRKTDDNAEWVNVLKEPILVRKGSEIKCLSSYIDAPGIDQEIIQFTRSGSEQDNVHTFLSQMYITNDGFQNKTTSYDYMCNRTTQNIKIVAQGGATVGIGITNPTPAGHVYVLRQFDSSGLIQGDGMEMKGPVPVTGALDYLQITNGGTNFNDGDVWNLTETGANPATGKIKVGALGEIIGFTYENYGSGFSGTGLQLTISSEGFINNTTAQISPVIVGGVGVTLQLHGSKFGSESGGVLNNDHPGNGLYTGDVAQVWLKAPNGTQTDTGARCFPMCLYQKSPARQLTAVNDNPSYFDPGYNYQRCPLYRWCQTYENTSLFTYGRNFFRNYVADDGNAFTLSNRSSINKKDLCFSAAYLLRNKEDEFVPGFFHKNFDTVKTPGNFNIYRPTIVIGPSTGASNFNLGRDISPTSEFPNCGMIEVFEDTRKVFLDPQLPKTVENQTIIGEFWNNPLAVGMAIQIDFDFVSDDPAIRSDSNLLKLHQKFIAPYAGVYTVGGIKIRNDGTRNFKQVYIGAPVKYDSTGNSDLNSTLSYKQASRGLVTNVGFARYDGSATGLTDGNGLIICCELAQSPVSHFTAGNSVVGVLCNTSSGGIIDVVYIFDSEQYGGGGNWKVGQTLKSVQPGDSRIPAGWSTIPQTGTNADIRFVITQVDNMGGCDFSTWDTLSQPHLTIDTGDHVNMIITPVPYYMQGIQTNTPNTNGIGLQHTNGATYFDSGTSYPPTRENAFLLNGGASGPGKTLQFQCGLYKPNGFKRGAIEATPTNIDMQIHDKDNSFTIVNNQIPTTNSDYLQNLTWDVGGNIINSHIYMPGSGAILGGQFPTSQLTFNFTKISADFPLITNIWQLPNMGLLILNEGQANERHVICSGNMTVNTVNPAPGTPQVHVTILLKSLSTKFNSNYPMTLPTTMTDSPGAYISPSLKPGDTITGNLSGPITVSYWNKVYNMNNGAQVKLDEVNGTGTMAWTSTQNFFGNNDVNYNSNSLFKGYSWSEIRDGAISNTEVNAYDKGGFYYLTQAKNALTESTVDIPKFYGFSQGYGEFPLQDVSDFRTFSTHLAPKVYNNKLIEDSDTLDISPNIEYSQTNNATNVYGYEPYYQQKTFKIDRNFVVPSDIASRWNEQSHIPTGLIDRDLGTVLASDIETGLIQNEFIVPIYPSNNEIGGNGEYIRDLNQHPYSGGLLGGHMVGVGFLPKGQEFLNPNMLGTMTKFIGRITPNYNTTDTIHYKIFMRNAFTFIRNYDPLAEKAPVPIASYHPLPLPAGAADQVSMPDRTPINQLQTQARNIGNFSIIATPVGSATQPAVPAKPTFFVDKTPTPKYFDPASAQPAVAPSTDKVYLPNLPPNSTTISEGVSVALMPNTSAVAAGPFDPGTSTPFRGNSIGYPVRYLENNLNGDFDRAVSSNYCGTTNLTLAFQTDISAFTFQFLMQPFTSPFVDGGGGDLSTRIFYGNRKKGLFNHDSFGGLTVWNYCRPNYPKGTFSFEDTLGENTQSSVYPNGVNPFRDTAVIGQRFLNKLGFADTDIGVTKNKIDGYGGLISGNNLGYNGVEYSETYLGDNGNQVVKSIDLTIKGTNYSDIDSSDAILSSIDAPENTAGLFANSSAVTAGLGVTNIDSRINLNGDYIFYPYSFSGATDSFNSSSSTVRFDNCTDAFGSMGGGISKNMGRGMGLPNTQGSTSIVDKNSIPITMNADCNLYLSFTVETSSNFIKASKLPIKMNHGHLVILSSLIEDPNFIMSKAQAVNGISVVSKAYITADFILSTGFISFYAKRDRIISSITTSIKNTAFENPTVLGDNSTVIYQITDFQPKPLDRPNQISEIQDNDYQIMAMVNDHMSSVHEGRSSALDSLEQELYNLGAITIGGGDNAGPNADVISQLRSQIDATGLSSMNAGQRAQFFQTDAGKVFLQNASDAQQVMTNVRSLEGIQMTQALDSTIAPKPNQQILDVVRHAQQVSSRITDRSDAVSIGGSMGLGSVSQGLGDGFDSRGLSMFRDELSGVTEPTQAEKSIRFHQSEVGTKFRIKGVPQSAPGTLGATLGVGGSGVKPPIESLDVVPRAPVEQTLPNITPSVLQRNQEPIRDDKDEKIKK